MHRGATTDKFLFATVRRTQQVLYWFDNPKAIRWISYWRLIYLLLDVLVSGFFYSLTFYKQVQKRWGRHFSEMWPRWKFELTGNVTSGAENSTSRGMNKYFHLTSLVLDLARWFFYLFDILTPPEAETSTSITGHSVSTSCQNIVNKCRNDVSIVHPHLTGAWWRHRLPSRSRVVSDSTHRSWRQRMVTVQTDYIILFLQSNLIDEKLLIIY